MQKVIKLLSYKGMSGRDELIRRVHGSKWSINLWINMIKWMVYLSRVDDNCVIFPSGLKMHDGMGFKKVVLGGLRV